MKISYEPKFNFHNQSAITLIITGKRPGWNADGDVYYVSKRQAKRIEKHFCGMKECGCPKGEVQQLDQDGTEWGIPVHNCK